MASAEQQIVLTIHLGQTPGTGPERPRELVDSSWDASYNRPPDRRVLSGGNVQKAIDDALPGELIHIDP